uniref:Uncharacterized protein n=1 Tax=uncultured marine thaumarchaeote SAT1000_06_B02 TaxID=1456361 RepID=A0A075I1N2_9ARCH|nr:hypothetical protein [uncultured marine thaumarchaeote SAT1000_06_B02]
MMKKLPKKYPVPFDVSFTRKAENLVCKNVEIIGNVIFVILSKHSILGITVNASSSSDNKWDTAREITELVWVVSASVNNNKSPEAFLYPSIHAQFSYPPIWFWFRIYRNNFWKFFEYSFIIFPVESFDESLIAIIS